MIPVNATTVATENDPRTVVPFLECLIDDSAVIRDLVTVRLPMGHFAAVFPIAYDFC